MKKFNEKDMLICPHCQYEFQDACEDFVLQGVNKQIGSIQDVECDNCYGIIGMCDNGDGTITVCKGDCDD